MTWADYADKHWFVMGILALSVLFVCMGVYDLLTAHAKNLLKSKP